MGEEKRGVTYSSYGMPYDPGLVGLFQGSLSTSNDEDKILLGVMKRSKYKTSNLVAIGFKRINTQDIQNSLSIDELFLTRRGAVESVDQRQEAGYKKLKSLSAQVDRLSHHLTDSKILALIPQPRDKNQDKRQLPHYIELDDDRVLALYITINKI